jgi:hypothetical protein
MTLSYSTEKRVKVSQMIAALVSQVCRSFFVLTLAPMFFRLLRVAPATPAVAAMGKPQLRGPDPPES